MARTGTVIPQGLNFRATPGGTILKVLPKGTVVEILETQNGTLKVDVSGQVGFVAAQFIQQQAAGAAGTAGGSATADATAATGTFRFVGTKAVAPDGSVFGKQFKKGIFNNGTTSIADFVSALQAAFAGISPSRLRVMAAVSANEGKLEAINTWDNAFVTFGCFQWTVGAENDPGELPAMVNRLKQTNPGVFQQLLGQFGLDIASVSSPPGVTPTGFLSLNGAVVRTAADK